MRKWIFLFMGALTACQTLQQSPYYTKQGLLQGSILLRAKALEDTLQNPRTSPLVKQRLLLTQELLKYAQHELGMHTGVAYRKYYDLKRPWLTQVVTAAHKEKLELHYFEFPIVGKVPYQGFFIEKDAEEFAQKLREQNLDVYIRPVTAFSSLGWFADPLLNTMIESEAYLIDLVLHELTHLNFYFKNYADFNEAFATWYASETAQSFLSRTKTVQNIEATKVQMRTQKEKMTRFSEVVGEIQDYGKQFYSQPGRAREEYFQWIAQTLKRAGFEKMAAEEWNNARVLSLSTYYKLLPKIESYARKRKLSAPQLLRALQKEGTELVEEILKTEAQ